jgi:thiamine-phosphate diphosphorylase
VHPFVSFDLYVILDPRPEGAIARALALMEAAKERIAIQVRAKGDTREVHARALDALRKPAAALDVPLFVSTHVELAAAHGVGVHLPESAPSIEIVRGSFAGPIGVSCHDAAGLARRRGADFAVLGPIFDVPGKGAPLGFSGLEALGSTSLPLYALGGIKTADHVRRARAAGARGVAVAGALAEGDALATLTELLSGF